MVNDVVDTVWSLFRAKHRDVDAADSRRCLLERHLQGRWEAHVSDAKNSRARLGLLGASSRRRMLRLMERLVRRVAAGSARPVWTLLAVSKLVSAVIVLVFRSVLPV
jgi:hypothetical protein